MTPTPVSDGSRSTVARDRLIGALTVNGQTEIMKYRVMITKGASWEEAREFAERRRIAHEEKLATAGR